VDWKEWGRKRQCPNLRKLNGGLRKTTKTCQDSRSPYWNLNLGPPVFETEILATRSRCSVSLIRVTKRLWMNRCQISLKIGILFQTLCEDLLIWQRSSLLQSAPFIQNTSENIWKEHVFWTLRRVTSSLPNFLPNEPEFRIIACNISETCQFAPSTLYKRPLSSPSVFRSPRPTLKI
jgi:hypothetical protein